MVISARQHIGNANRLTISLQMVHQVGTVPFLLFGRKYGAKRNLDEVVARKRSESYPSYDSPMF
jgi:hypothetical protein